MGPDYYKVKVLHYINPYLIWVVLDNDNEEITFGQIGTYGVLPLNLTIDIDGTVDSEISDEWMPVVTCSMQKILQRAKEVWFSPCIQKNTSIFNNDSHTFGDIIFKLHDGSTKNLVNILTDAGFALEDDCLFDEELKTGTINHKIDLLKTACVIKTLKKAYTVVQKPKKLWENALDAQTSVISEALVLEGQLSKDDHHRGNAEKMLQNKLDTLKLMKDVDYESIGRGSSSKSSKSPSTSLSMRLQKRLDCKAPKTDNQVNDTVKRTSLNDSFERDTEGKDSFKRGTESNDYLRRGTKLKDSCKSNDNYVERKVENIEQQVKVEAPTIFQKRMKKDKKPDPNEDKQFIAFGPPGIDPRHMPLKVKEYKDPEPEIAKKEEKPNDPEKVNIKKVNQDMFDKEDSEINITITNLESLKATDTSTTYEKPSNNSMKTRFERLKLKKLNTNIPPKIDKRQEFSSSESLTSLVNKIDIGTKIAKHTDTNFDNKLKNNVNPFKNIDGSQSVFVEKLVSPTLMVHTKKENRIQSITKMRDVPFGSETHVILRNMGVINPMRIQTVSWKTILRGHSMFLVSPYGSGKTLGYLPAICRLVTDFTENCDKLVGIILCATSESVARVERLSKIFLHKSKVFACYLGMDNLHITTTLLNGCNLLICTPIMFVRLIQSELGIDLHDLSTFVIDDCERIDEVYSLELKYILKKVKDSVKTRINKEHKVQYVLASRIWCDFMKPLAKKVPDTVICIGAFQECVLYSESKTSVDFVKKENKIDTVLKFLESIDRSKKTVVACRTDNEVKNLEKVLKEHGYVVFACDSTMTILELPNLASSLRDYQDPVTGPVLICCDNNLMHLNVTDASYLIHYSLPELFSMFCKRFACLIENYKSVFDTEDNCVKIKILLENCNLEQLPKILHFIKRCTDSVPASLDDISTQILVEKDLNKADAYIPLCNTLLTLGKCPDFWNCKERHTIFKKFDEPKSWVPKEGLITFEILHYNSAVCYSAVILSNNVNNQTEKFPNTCNSLGIRMSMYYGDETNRKLHGVPKIGDVCAVTLKQNLFVRGQVMKILEYSQRGHPQIVLVKLIDRETYERAHDTSLYFLPDELKNVETYVTRVILANITPGDKDISHSEVVTRRLKAITEQNSDIFLRGKIALTVGNIIFVETLEACQDLATMSETIVISNFKQELLEGHSIHNPEHIGILKRMSKEIYKFDTKINENESPKITTLVPYKSNIKNTAVVPNKTSKIIAKWAHLEANDFSSVFFLCAQNPHKFFVRLTKFKSLVDSLIKDIQKHVENSLPIDDIKEGDIVIAEFPDDSIYERARVEVINNKKVKCFFVDQGDWREVSAAKVYPITEKFVNQIPFQAIECKLIGIQPVGENWTDFETNWLVDTCYDTNGDAKYLYAKYFTKEMPESTDGRKYGIVLMDTYYENDVMINKMIIENNMARETDEVKYFDDANFKRDGSKTSDSEEWSVLSEPVFENTDKNNDLVPAKSPRQLIRSVPLIGSESENESEKSWDFNKPQSFVQLFNTKGNNSVVITEADEDSNTNITNKLNSDVETKNVPKQDPCKPKLVWRQNKKNVIIKIQLIIESNYKISIKDRSLEFSATVNDTYYNFEISLYGVIDVKKSTHCSKGLYVQVNLKKILPCEWKSLINNGSAKWITYDVDNIDVSDDEVLVEDKDKAIVLDHESETDDDFFDDFM